MLSLSNNPAAARSRAFHGRYINYIIMLYYIILNYGVRKAVSVPKSRGIADNDRTYNIIIRTTVLCDFRRLQKTCVLHETYLYNTVVENIFGGVNFYINIIVYAPVVDVLLHVYYNVIRVFNTLLTPTHPSPHQKKKCNIYVSS